MQINISSYQTLKPGTTGLYCPGGVPCTPVVFKDCDGVTVRIQGEGVRPEWHMGLHAGLLMSLFSWDISTGGLDYRTEDGWHIMAACGHRVSGAVKPGDKIALCPNCQFRLRFHSIPIQYPDRLPESYQPQGQSTQP